MILGLCVSAILLVGSIYDWKCLRLPVWLLAGGLFTAVLGTGIHLLQGDRNGLEVLAAFLPGACVMLLSFATREQIGYGDGLMLLIMGGCMNIEWVIWSVFLALAGVFAVSVGLLITRKADYNRKLPFVPFLFVGNILTLLFSGRGL